MCYKKKPIIPETPQIVYSRVRLNTQFPIQDIQVSTNTPPHSKQELFKYNCPICMRYFSTILVSVCCGHYICRFCAEDLQRRTEEVCCPECRVHPYQVVDVNPHSNIKIYSDSKKNRWFNPVSSVPIETDILELTSQLFKTS